MSEIQKLEPIGVSLPCAPEDKQIDNNDVGTSDFLKNILFSSSRVV